MNAKRLIPRSKLVDLYLELREAPQEERLAIALELEAAPFEFARIVTSSFETFVPFDNRDQPFCEHVELAPTERITNGREFVRALATGEVQKGQKGSFVVRYGRTRLAFTFVDYEVPPARTDANAPLFANAFERGGNSLLIRTDAVLGLSDGTPVVAEFKVAKEKGYDTDTFVALVEGLAAAAMLGTPNQLERLRRSYPLELKPGTSVDLAILLYKPTVLAHSTFQYRLDAVAWMLAYRVMQEPSITKAIRRIYFIHASGDPQNLKFEAVGVAERPAE